MLKEVLAINDRRGFVLERKFLAKVELEIGLSGTGVNIDPARFDV